MYVCIVCVYVCMEGGGGNFNVHVVLQCLINVERSIPYSLIFHITLLISTQPVMPIKVPIITI